MIIYIEIDDDDGVVVLDKNSNVYKNKIQNSQHIIKEKQQPINLLSLSNYLLIYILELVLQPLEFNKANSKTQRNFCYIDSFNNVNNILVRYGMICKRFANHIIPKLTNRLQLFIQDGLDLKRMMKLSKFGLLSNHNNNNNIYYGLQFGHIEISRYSKIDKNSSMAVLGVSLPPIKDSSDALMSVQSLTVESLLSTPSFLISLMSNTSLTRLSLSTGQFDYSYHRQLINMISTVSSSLCSLKLFHASMPSPPQIQQQQPQQITNNNHDFIMLLTDHYANNPSTYFNLVNLSLTGYKSEYIADLLALPQLTLNKLKLYGTHRLDNRLAQSIGNLSTLRSLSCCSIEVDIQSSGYQRMSQTLAKQLTKFHFSKLYVPVQFTFNYTTSTNLLPKFTHLETLIISDITIPSDDFTNMMVNLKEMKHSLRTLVLSCINILSESALTYLIGFIRMSRSLRSLTLDSIFNELLLSNLFSIALKDNTTMRHLTFVPFYKHRFKVSDDIAKNVDTFVNHCKGLKSFNFYGINFPSYVIKSLFTHQQLNVIKIGRIRKPHQFSTYLSESQSIHTLNCTNMDGTNQETLELLQTLSKSRNRILQSLTLSLVVNCSKLMLYLIDLMFKQLNNDNSNNNYNFITKLSLKIDPYCPDEILLQLTECVTDNSLPTTQLESLMLTRISSLKHPKSYQHLQRIIFNGSGNSESNSDENQIYNNHYQTDQTLLPQQQNHHDELEQQSAAQNHKEEYIHVLIQRNLKCEWEFNLTKN